MRLSEIDGEVLQRFRDHDCGCGHPQFFGGSGSFRGGEGSGRRLAKFASFLVERGVVADWREEVPHESRGTHAAALLDWLRQHRGLRASTLRNSDYCQRWLLSRPAHAP